MAIKDLIFLKQRVVAPAAMGFTELTVDAAAGTFLDMLVFDETAPGAYVDWGDGNTEPVLPGSVYPIQKMYPSAGVVTVRVYGNGRLYVNGVAGNAKVIACTAFNTTHSSVQFLFCEYLVSVPASLPPSITSTEGMFNYCTNFNQNISGWNVSAVTNMNSMLANTPAFNQDLSSWVTGLTAQPSDFSYGGNATFADNANNLKPFLAGGVTRINT